MEIHPRIIISYNVYGRSIVFVYVDQKLSERWIYLFLNVQERV